MTAKQKMSRRNFIRSSVVMGGAWMVAGSIPVESIAGEVRPEIAKSESSAGVSKVYMLTEEHIQKRHLQSLRQLLKSLRAASL
mgnify:CR=1 FL=1